MTLFGVPPPDCLPPGGLQSLPAAWLPSLFVFIRSLKGDQACSFPCPHIQRFCRSCSWCSFLQGRALSCWPALEQKAHPSTFITSRNDKVLRRMFINILYGSLTSFPDRFHYFHLDRQISSGHSEGAILSGEETDIYLSNGYKK